jgi:hypothetical protein
VEAHGTSGLNVWIPVPEEVPAVQLLLESGWAVRGGEPFRLRTGPAIRITTSTLQPDEADSLAADIARILEPTFRSRTA